MRYFKRIKDDSLDLIEIGKIYKGTDSAWSDKIKLSVEQSAKAPHSSENWKEVSKKEYLEQEGWYIKGSMAFRNWVDKNNINRNNFGCDCFNHWYTIGSRGIIGRFFSEDKPKGIEITVDELDEIFNMKDKNFKVGDEVLITSWDYVNIKLPQKGIIKSINKNDCRIEIEKDHHGERGSWWFTYDEFEHVNTKIKENKQMEQFSVKVNPTTSKILQKLAFENGYIWNGANHLYDQKVQHINKSRLHFYSDKTICFSRNTNDKYSVSLEEAIELITSKEEKFKEGEYAVVIQKDNSLSGQVVRITLNGIFANLPYRGTKLDSNRSNSFKSSQLRKATDKEIKEALIKEAKRRGYVNGTTINVQNIYQTVDKRDYIISDDKSYDYHPHNDFLDVDADTDQCGAIVYKNGKWAEIIDEPKEIFGFKVTKLQNGDYKFGCNDHVYSQSELSRIVDTLSEITVIHSVQELRDKLYKLINS